MRSLTRSILVATPLALALAACGAPRSGAAHGGHAGAYAGTQDEQAPPEPERAWSRVDVGDAVAARADVEREDGARGALLSVYTDGPRPLEVDRSAAMPFEAAILMVNEGDGAADLRVAHVELEVWSGGERTACSPPVGGETLRVPPRLEARAAHELRVVSVCPVPLDGEYRVHAYLSFEASGEDPSGGELALARYSAGVYPDVEL